LSDWILIYKFYVSQVAYIAADGRKLSRTVAAFIQFAFQRPVEDIPYQRAFAGTGNACDYSHHIEREPDVDSFQVILPRSFQFDIVVPRTAVFGNGNFFFSQK